MNRQKQKGAIFLPVVLGITLLTLFWVVNSRRNSQQQANKTENSSINSGGTGSNLNETENWKEYTFNPLNLTLKVPSDLNVHTEEPNSGKDFVAYIQNYPYSSPYPKTGAFQLYLVWQNSPEITDGDFRGKKEDLIYSSIKETTVGGYAAIRGQINSERNRLVTYILKDKTLISIFTSEPTEANQKLTDQILSTFKFGNTSLITTSTWLTYKNNQYGFEFKHPKELIVNKLTSNEIPQGGSGFGISSLANDTKPNLRIIIDQNSQSDIKSYYQQVKAGDLSGEAFSPFDDQGKLLPKVVTGRLETGQDTYRLNDTYCVTSCDITTFSHGKYIYSFLNWDIASQRDVYNKILSTFRFN